MNLKDSISIISGGLNSMNEIYGRPLFDEIAIVALKERMPEIYYYEGPRGASFANEFLANTQAIRSELDKLATHRESFGGELFFTNEGDGVHMDACLCIGPPQVYLFCNNVRKSMVEIRADPKWPECKSKLQAISASFSLNPFSIGAQGL